MLIKFLRLWGPVIFWCGLIFYFSGIPQLSTGWGIWDLILRKAAHIAEYLILAFLFYRAIKGTFNPSSFYLLFWPSALTFLYAVSDEFHQSFISGRGCSGLDVLIDSTGIIIFYIILHKIKGVRNA